MRSPKEFWKRTNLRDKPYWAIVTMQAVCCCYWNEPIDQWGRVKMTEGAWGWGVGAISKMFAIQEWGAKFDPQNPFKTCQAWWNTLIFPQLQRQTQVDLWGSLSSQPHLAGKLQVKKKLLFWFCLNVHGIWNDTWNCLLLSAHTSHMSMRSHPQTWMYTLAFSTLTHPQKGATHGPLCGNLRRNESRRHLSKSCLFIFKWNRAENRPWPMLT